MLITLEGGYNPEGLREGTRAVLNAFLGKASPLTTHAPAQAAEQVIMRIIATHRKHWKSLK